MLDFDRSFASSPKAEFWSDVNEKKPREVFKSSGKKFWFNCSECIHSFDTQLNVVAKGHWCPYCVNQRLCEEDCTYCLEKSFASHPKAEFWDYIKNVKNPRQVFKSCNKKFWFNCGDCEHSFDTTLGHVTNNNRWCPYCAKPSRKLCEEDCTRCLEKSFASNPKAEFWDYLKNEKNPRQVFKSCNKKFWFNCDECGHNFDTQLDSISTGTWCPFCAKPPQRMCEEDCSMCFEKSFAGHPKAEFWDYNKNKKNPKQVFKSSHKKFWFNCSDCEHKFKSRLNSVTKGSWCPMCVNKTEKIFLVWFKANYDHVIKHQPKYDWCKNKLRLPFDFSVESLKLIIEIDGPQHFIQISNWQSPEITQKNDEYKTKMALENGYTVIRILQEDIFKNIKGWEDELVKILN